MNIKKIIKSVLFGIMWGCTFFTLFGLIYVLFGSDIRGMDRSEYILQATLSMVVGIGFSLPSLIYENENLSMPIKTMVHMGVGYIIYFICAPIAGWVPLSMGIGILISSIVFMVGFGFLIWFIFYIYYKHEAKCINEKLNENK